MRLGEVDQFRGRGCGLGEKLGVNAGGKLLDAEFIEARLGWGCCFLW